MSTFQATAADIPRIIPCARAFCAKLGWPLHERAYVRSLQQMVEGRRGAVFLIEDAGEIVGGIAGALQADEFSGTILAVEKFWYVKESHRGSPAALKILALFERWARAAGAVHIVMIAMEASDPGKMDELYKRLGYIRLETTYIK